MREERIGAGEDLVAVLVEDGLAAEVECGVPALVDDRVAGDVQHRIAVECRSTAPNGSIEDGAGEEVAHRAGIARVVGQRSGCTCR